MSDKEVFMAAYQINKLVYKNLLQCLAVSQNTSKTKMAEKIKHQKKYYSPQFREFCAEYEDEDMKGDYIEF